MIVVTGGAGFIGSALIAALNGAKIFDILVVDEFGTSSRWKNLLGKRYLDFLHKDDFLQKVIEEKLPREIEAIVHMGACSSTTERDSDYLYRNNFLYTKLLAEYAAQNDIRFIYASSAATYGDGAKGYSDSHDSLHELSPLNPYGFSKYLFDLWANENDYLDKVCGLKFFNVFGPNEYFKGEMRSMVMQSFEQVTATGSVRLFKSHRDDYKDGEQKRDFIYVKDCCDVILWLLNKSSANGIFNLGSGKARSWNDLTKAVFSSLKKEPKIEYVDMPDDLKGQYQYFTEAPINKLKEAGYKNAFCSLEDGVKDYVENYLSKGFKVF